MTVQVRTRCCGNCFWWGRGAEESNGLRPCNWTIPEIPFWAYVTAGGDGHEDWTKPYDGTRCAAFKLKQ